MSESTKQITCGTCNKKFTIVKSDDGSYKGTHACDAAYVLDEDGVASPVFGRSGLTMRRPEAQPPNTVPHVS